jgi:flagellar protein FlaG
MTQMINTTGAVTDPTLGSPTPTPTPTPAPPPQTSASDAADLRLVIEDDQAAGCFVYKTVDWRTGEVVQQIPREQILKMREATAYSAGDVIKTEA